MLLPLRAALAGLLLAGLFSGCVGGTADSESVGAGVQESLAFDADTGAIRGLVTSTELQPIVGARITILETGVSTNTSADGSFFFSSLAPATHQLVFEALGYVSVARKVDVLAGEVAEVRVALEVLPIVEPYVELLIFRGFAICDVNAVLIIYSPGPIPGCTQMKSVFRVSVKDTWRYAIVEAAWKTQDSLHLTSDTDSTCLFGTSSSNPCYNWTTGRSPLRLDARPNTTWALAPPSFRYPEGAFTWVVNGFGAGLLQREIAETAACRAFRPNGPPCGGVGFNAFGFAFDVYVSIFHLEPPDNPSVYSARPDS